MYTHTHTRIRKYVMVGANLPPPGRNRVNQLVTLTYSAIYSVEKQCILCLNIVYTQLMSCILGGPANQIFGSIFVKYTIFDIP